MDEVFDSLELLGLENFPSDDGSLLFAIWLFFFGKPLWGKYAPFRLAGGKGFNAHNFRSVLETLLQHPALYQFVQDVIGGTRARQWTVERYVRLQPGESTLDLGCGPGDLLKLLPATADFKYLGIDLSEKYLNVAAKRANDSIDFVQGDCAHFLPLLDGRRFDWIFCMGLLHHLSDAQCQSLLSAAAQSLTEKGSLICLEPTLSDSQSRLTHATMSLDRGEYLRTEDEWRQLFDSEFRDVTMYWLDGAFRIPYQKTVSVLQKPR